MKVLCFTNIKDSISVKQNLLDNSCDILDIITTKDNLKNLHKTASQADIILSYCYRSLIPDYLLDLPKLGAINFHPAPLPEYRGFAVYNFAILNNEKSWGVTCHHMDKKFDTGDIIFTNSMDIDPLKHTAFSLRKISRKMLKQALKDFLKNPREFMKVRKINETNKGKHYSRGMFNNMREINDNDNEETINRKIRAFWCPPHEGAYITKNNHKYMLVDHTILDILGE